ncbi:MAG: molybdopterin-dependent oxidoreductase [Limnobacter sp.]|uniref:molybdopterin-dependent oxidoreductase n=1 Tax=Limnobacter sp. TaxID=2003368 RepID=UPI00391902AD
MTVFKNRIERLDGADEIVRDALSLILPKVADAGRRNFLRQSLTLGGVALLSGCSLTDNTRVEAALQAISRFNDDMQARLFNPNLLAPTYPDSMITRPFPFNAYYGEDEVRVLDGTAWRLQMSGLVGKVGQHRWSLDDLRALPQSVQTTRHICVEGWSAIGRWGGVQLSEVLKRSQADLRARYVDFRCADGYHTSIDMATALHPQTIVALDWDGEPLPPKYGYPVKVRIPTKLGYKNPKHIETVIVTNEHPGGYWEDQGYNWFGGC